MGREPNEEEPKPSDRVLSELPTLILDISLGFMSLVAGSVTSMVQPWGVRVALVTWSHNLRQSQIKLK